MRIRLVVPGNVRHNSGGNVYNAALARELAALGVEVQTCMLDGGWPVGSAEDRQRLAAVLCDDAGDGGGAAPGTGGAGGPTVTVVDGLLACGAPEALEAARAAGLPAWILLHMPLDDTGHDEAVLERRVLEAAAGVICTSTSAAARIRARHGLDGTLVALPGTDPAPRSAGSEPPHLVFVAALLPNKDQALLLAALGALADLPWTASLIGSDTPDPGYATHLRGTVQRLGLQDRIRIPGELRGAALAAEWDAAGLTLLISRAETFGLVVTESIARGVPVVVRAGTGAVEALAAGTPAPEDGAAAEKSAANLPGAAVALDADPAPLVQVLRRWLSDPGVRSGWRAAALEARGRLPGWDATARAVLAALDPDHPAGHPPATPGEKRASDDSPPAPAGGQ